MYIMTLRMMWHAMIGILAMTYVYTRYDETYS